MNRAACQAFVVASRLVRGFWNRRLVIYDPVWKPVRGKLNPGCIFASNHPTSLDPIYVYDLIEDPAILMTEFCFSLPILGPLFRAMGCIPVPIPEHDPRRRCAYSAALNALCAGRNLLVAPEGKMSADCNQPKTGIVRLSNQTGKSIVPIGIRHEGKVFTFHITSHGHRQKVRFMPCGTTFVRIGSPIFPATDHSPTAAVNYVMREIRRLSAI